LEADEEDEDPQAAASRASALRPAATTYRRELLIQR
jgi:hypothetical protein